MTVSVLALASYQATFSALEVLTGTFELKIHRQTLQPDAPACVQQRAFLNLAGTLPDTAARR